MIAPIRETTVAPERQQQLRTARRLAAQALLRAPRQEPRLPTVPRWQAWLLVAWMAVTATCYVGLMVSSFLSGG